MTQYGLVGEKLGHSFSPEIHHALGDYEYCLIEVPKNEIDAFFEKKDFLGLNVTIPYKETVISHLDEISDAAREIGAVNTVVNREGKLFGYNTDCIGMKDAIIRAGIEMENKKVLILGSGGTSKTAGYVAKTMGAREILFLSRREREGFITYEEALKSHTDAEIIINTTPAGMYPDVSGCPIDIGPFKKLSGVFDAVFNPLKTNLILAAEEKNVPCSGGLYMLVSQAVHASAVFTKKEADSFKADEIYEKLKSSKENIVLIGMPSSGKSSIGKLIARKLSRRFADTDSMVSESEGMEISEIFEKFSEVYFRDAESRAVNEASLLSGAVIATGGGAILREENVKALKRNGRLYFLDRSLEKLISTDDRPLSKNRESLERRYNERIHIYRKSCDTAVDGDGTVEETASVILEEFGK